jgi:hypothetical protein
VSNEPDHVMRCPRCFGRDVRRSQHRGVIDNFMKRLHRWPFRCRGCQNRFYSYVSKGKDEEVVAMEVQPGAVETVSEQHAETAEKPETR